MVLTIILVHRLHHLAPSYHLIEWYWCRFLSRMEFILRRVSLKLVYVFDVKLMIMRFICSTTERNGETAHQYSPLYAHFNDWSSGVLVWVVVVERDGPFCSTPILRVFVNIFSDYVDNHMRSNQLINYQSNIYHTSSCILYFDICVYCCALLYTFNLWWLCIL